MALLARLGSNPSVQGTNQPLTLTHPDSPDQMIMMMMLAMIMMIMVIVIMIVMMKVIFQTEHRSNRFETSELELEDKGGGYPTYCQYYRPHGIAGFIFCSSDDLPA